MSISYVVIICPCLGISFSASTESSVYPLPLGWSVLFFSRFLSILNCLFPFCLAVLSASISAALGVFFPIFFDNGAAFSDLPVLVCDFFLGSSPFSCFVIKYASGGNLDVRFGKQFPFAEYEVDVIIGFAFIVVQTLYTFHSVLLSEFIRKFFKHQLWVKGGVNLRQGTD